MWCNMMRSTKSQKVSVLYYSIYIYIYTLVLERKGNKLMPNQIKIITHQKCFNIRTNMFRFKNFRYQIQTFKILVTKINDPNF